jgi:hypothetical protein
VGEGEGGAPCRATLPAGHVAFQCVRWRARAQMGGIGMGCLRATDVRGDWTAGRLLGRGWGEKGKRAGEQAHLQAARAMVEQVGLRVASAAEGEGGSIARTGRGWRRLARRRSLGTGL